MAGFGFGVGDIIALTTIIIKTVEDIHDAPEELQDLAERVAIVDNILESTHEKLPHSAPVRNMKNIVKLKDRVKEVLNTMKDIVTKYRDNEGKVNLFHKVVYSVHDKGEIAKLVIKLEERTKNLTDFLLVQIWDTNNLIRPLIEQILRQIRQDQEPANIQNTGSDQTDQVQAVFDHVLQNERSSDATLLPDQQDVSIEKEIVIQLEQAGVGSTFTKALVEKIDKQRKQLFHTEDIDPLSYTRGTNRLEDPKGWIMVIDSYNEVRSIIAQTYLELVRVWTVNNSGEWLFNRVESAGVRVATKFARRCFKSQPQFLVEGGEVPNIAALEAISGAKSHFRSDEKKDILARIAQHRSRGLDNWHFRKFEYMLCFDKTAYENVTTLAKYCKQRYGDIPSYAKLSKVILIDDIKLKASIANADATTKLVESIKNGIKSFLRAQYHWERPPLSISEGPFRTKQIVLLNIDVKLSPAAEEAKVKEISTKTDCRIRVTDERFDSQLLTITGRSEALPLASSLLKAALLEQIPSLSNAP